MNARERTTRFHEIEPREDRIGFYRVEAGSFGTTFGAREEALDFIEAIPPEVPVSFFVYFLSGRIFGAKLPTLRERIELA